MHPHPSARPRVAARHLPALRGGLQALAAALLFGLSTPLIQRAGVGVGSLSTAALLYAGAAGMGTMLRRRADREAPLRRGDAPRVVLTALLGAALGPVALAWGLQRTDATAASLMLTLEAALTALLAALVWREPIDRRIAVAIALIGGGGAALLLDRARAGGGSLVGLFGIGLATLAWALDNTVSRGLADRDPGQVVMWKSGLGAALTFGLGRLLDEPLPGIGATLALLGIGATGYGLSLRLYLLAQRAFGAARTGSVFAFAPFAGAAAALALGGRGGGPLGGLGAGMMAVGVVLHLTERHAHVHDHGSLAHEHAHTHDDGHHLHAHVPMPAGPHSHPHVHAPMQHAHPHVPDEHHAHSH